MRKRRTFILAMGSVILLLFACKKVTKEVNAEKDFTLYFLDDSAKVKNVCFDRIYGEGRLPLTVVCSQYSLGLSLPLNIGADSSRFFFERGKKRDTLTVYYTITYEGGGPEYEVFYNKLKVKSSFPTLVTRCVSGVTLQCNGNEAYLAATVF